MKKSILFIFSVLSVFIMLQCMNNSRTEVYLPNGYGSCQDSLIVSYISFWEDSLLNKQKGIARFYINKYITDSCQANFLHEGIETVTSCIKEKYEGVHTIKSIKGNNHQDTVFVMPPFNNCESGDSYYFFDLSLPRLQTDSECCHPSNFFVIEDIDEDGINEVGTFYSSCASRYKSLIIYSLKNNIWHEIGASTFDILTQDPDSIDFTVLVKKTRKNEFKICSFIDGMTEWDTLKME